MFKLLNFLTPKPAFAQTTEWSDRCVGTSGNFAGVAKIQGFECIFANILQIITVVAGLSFFAMFIVGGFKYLTSGGDPKKAAAASSTLGVSVIGIVGVIVSWLILLFIEKFTGAKVTIFKIGS